MVVWNVFAVRRLKEEAVDEERVGMGRSCLFVGVSDWGC